MVELYGKVRSRRDIAASAGSLSHFAGVRLMTLGDGVERGIRLLEFRTGTGLRFTVLVDRALDIADCEYRGMAVGWHSPAGFKHPGLAEYEGEGGLAWLRSFSGRMVTCGLDHILFMYDEQAGHYVYGPRKTVSHSIHGRIGTLPARLTGYGETWQGDECTLWCEGVVSQGTVFGEDLQLVRRIEAKVGSNEIRLHDRGTPPCGADPGGSVFGFETGVRIGQADVDAAFCEFLGDHEANPLPAGDQCDFVEDVHKFNGPDSPSLRRPPALSGLVKPSLPMRLPYSE